MIECRILDRPERGGYELFLWVPNLSMANARHPVSFDESGQLVVGPVEQEGAHIRPTMVLRYDEFAVLTEAIRQSGPHGSVEAHALSDARDVRDRMITLVEAAFTAQVEGRGYFSAPPGVST